MLVQTAVAIGRVALQLSGEDTDAEGGASGEVGGHCRGISGRCGACGGGRLRGVLLGRGGVGLVDGRRVDVRMEHGLGRFTPVGAELLTRYQARGVSHAQIWTGHPR